MHRPDRRDFLKAASLAAGATLVQSQSELLAAGEGISVGIMTEPNGAHLNWYLSSLARCEGVRRVAIADASGENFAAAAQSLGSRFGNVGTFRDHRRMIETVRPELALVTLEPVNSPKPIELALESNCHVLTEKPACVRLEDFERIAKTASGKHRHLMLALCNRNSPIARKAKELVETGAIGKVFGANIHLIADQTRLKKPEYHRLWRASKARAGGGILIWLGIHYLDLAEYICGNRAREICAFYGNVGGQPLDTEDAAAVAIKFDDGSMGTMEAGYYLDRGYQSQFAFWGSKGWIRFHLTENQPMEWQSTAAGAPKGVQTFADTSGFMVNGDNQYYPFVQSAVNAARGVEAAPISTEQGLHVVRAIFGAYRAADTGAAQKIV